MALVLAAQTAFAADEETNRKILKDALVGAVTGAVAAEATQDGAVPPPSADTAAAVKDFEKSGKPEKGPKKNFGKKKKMKKDKKRPYGWDQGKKAGWGDSEVPPGLAKKRGEK